MKAPVRSFSWNCFAVTGDIDAYLLYKDAETLKELQPNRAEWEVTKEEMAEG